MRKKTVFKKITFNDDMTDTAFTDFCNTCEKQGVFRNCGNQENKWVIVGFEDGLDCLAWMVGMGIVHMKEASVQEG